MNKITDTTGFTIIVCDDCLPLMERGSAFKNISIVSNKSNKICWICGENGKGDPMR